MDADSVLSWLDRLLAHASGSALVLSFLFGWGFMFLLIVPIRFTVKEPKLAGWFSWVSCVFSSTFMALLMWPPMLQQYRIGWALTIGFTSPALWWCLTHLLSYKFPAIANAIRIKRVSLDPTEGVENDVRPSEPGSNAT